MTMTNEDIRREQITFIADAAFATVDAEWTGPEEQNNDPLTAN